MTRVFRSNDCDVDWKNEKINLIVNEGKLARDSYAERRVGKEKMFLSPREGLIGECQCYKSSTKSNSLM